jgi:hypothetical protein
VEPDATATAFAVGTVDATVGGVLSPAPVAKTTSTQ